MTAEFRTLIPYSELLDLQAGLLAKYPTDAELTEIVVGWWST